MSIRSFGWYACLTGVGVGSGAVCYLETGKVWLTLGIALAFVFQFSLTFRCPPRYTNELVVGVIVAASVMGLVLSFIEYAPWGSRYCCAGWLYRRPGSDDIL